MSHRSLLSLHHSLLSLAFLGFSASSVAAQSSCTAQYGAALDPILQQPHLKSAHWGILVQDQTTNTPLYSQNPDRFFLPASNAKLFTTAAALLYLTPQFKRQTSFFSTGQPPNLTTLTVVGQGDPSLQGSQLEAIAQNLKAKGIRSIDALAGDDQFFKGNWIEPSWSWEDLQGGDGLPVNSLMVNGNAYDLQLIPQGLGAPLELRWLSTGAPRNWTVQNRTKTVDLNAIEFLAAERNGTQLVVKGQLHRGSSPGTLNLPVPDPRLHFLERFRAALNAHQISVKRLSVDPPSSPRTLIASIPLPSLSVLMNEINQQSNNLYAETLLRQMGTEPTLPPAEETAQRGLITLRSVLSQVGVNPQGYALVDGSGLSRKNLVTPRSLVQLLHAMTRSANFEVFRASLPVAGQSGSLRQRFVGTPLQGRLWAKTGTLQGVVALSGYLESSIASPRIFSILVNHSPLPTDALRQAVDQLMGAIAKLPNCR